jgi:hypothetical protein
MVDETVTTHAANGAAPRKGFSPKAMKDRMKVVTVEFDGERGDVWYRPWIITPRVMRELRDTTDEEQDNIGRIMNQIERFVHEWDVLDEDGQRLPVNTETMAELPNPFLVAVLNAVVSDMQPSPTTGDASSAG